MVLASQRDEFHGQALQIVDQLEKSSFTRSGFVILLRQTVELAHASRADGYSERESEALFEKRVTYSLLKDDRCFIVHGVPAWVNVETGEQLFAPETVEKLQKIIWEQKEPVREVITAIYEFSD